MLMLSPEWRPKSYNKANINVVIDMQVALVLRPSCVAEKVGVNKKGVNQTRYSHMKPWNKQWLWAVTPMTDSLYTLLHYYCVTDINSTKKKTILIFSLCKFKRNCTYLAFTCHGWYSTCCISSLSRMSKATLTAFTNQSVYYHRSDSCCS
jgi:hypothetical protein